MSKGTLPKSDDGPTIILQLFSDFSIPLHISADLGYPILTIYVKVVFKLLEPTPTPSIAVPKISIDEDSETVFPNYYIRPAWQIPSVKAESNATGMQLSAER